MRRINRGGPAFLAGDEDVNPMEGISNLADTMLVLAVGIMLALVMAWNVDISTSAPGSDSYGSYVEGATLADEVYVLTEEETDSADSTDSVKIDDFGLAEYGTVYVDKDGNFYVVEQDGQTGE